MLTTLRRIVQEVIAASDLQSSLQIVVSRVREAMQTQACTIFLVDGLRNEYVLMATEGLNKAAETNIRVGLGEGMVGLVGQREEPINLEDAPSHPKFYHHPMAGEEQFRAFLGVPIIHQRHLIGVLVAQQKEKRRFDEEEESFLVTLCAQLASVVAHAKAVGQIEGLSDPALLDEGFEVATLGGIPCVPGVGIGNAVVIYPYADLDAVPDRPVKDIDLEIANFEDALKATRNDIKSLHARLSTMIGAKELALFTAYLRMLARDDLGEEIIQEIYQGNWAQTALRKVIQRHAQNFAGMEDEYLRERASDIKDLGRRILAHLQEKEQVVEDYPDNTILVGEELSAADLAEVPEGLLCGIVSLKGSTNSHVAILARALNVPTVMGAAGTPLHELESKELIVDGYYGHIYVSPSMQLLQEFTALAQEEEQLAEELQELRDLPAQTSDGVKMSLYVNTGLAVDASSSLSIGASGVGLFRTEVPFMVRDRFPTEEEQRVIYRQLLSSFSPRPVVMRTLDIGGDKALPYFPQEEENPFLGWRGIRVTLDHPEIFLIQLRAMLRAAQGLDNLRIMLPMITSVTEVDEAIHLIKRAHSEVVEEGENVILPPIGVMIEVPSAVYQAQIIASRVDFKKSFFVFTICLFNFFFFN